MRVYMGQIMAECDCTSAACEQRGYCMADRIEELEAKLAKEIGYKLDYKAVFSVPQIKLQNLRPSVTHCKPSWIRQCKSLR